MAEINFRMSYSGYRRAFDISKPVDFCIYCGEDDPELLTDEHVAPEGLSGDLILLSASCKTCAALTGYSELRVLRGPLAIVREHHQLYGRRHEDERPEELPLEIRRKDWTLEKVMLPVSEFPFVFRMPRFPAPRLLRAAQGHDADYHRKFDYRQFDTADGINKAKQILSIDDQRERLELDMKVYELSKVLAKIAYGFAVVMLGPYSIRPYVVDLIVAPRGHAPSFLYYVGGAFHGNDHIEQLTTKDIGKVVVRIEVVNGLSVVVVSLQLLGYLNAPVYDIVVGELVSLDEPRPLVSTIKRHSLSYGALRLLSGQIVDNPDLASPGFITDGQTDS